MTGGQDQLDSHANVIRQLELRKVHRRSITMFTVYSALNVSKTVNGVLSGSVCVPLYQNRRIMAAVQDFLI